MTGDLLSLDTLLSVMRAAGPYIVGAIVFALIARTALKSVRRQRTRPRPVRWRKKAGRPFDAPYRRHSGVAAESSKAYSSDPNLQVGYVLDAQYRHRRLMNASEYAVFAYLRELLRDLGHRHHAFPQVPLKAFLDIEGENARRAVGSKRLDILVVDAAGLPALAVEYHGGGHFQGDAIQRDRIKKLALERAGIPLVELYRDYERTELRGKVCQALGLSDPRDARSASANQDSQVTAGPWGRSRPA